MAGLISCTPGVDGEVAGDTPADARPGAPGEDVTPPGDPAGEAPYVPGQLLTVTDDDGLSSTAEIALPVHAPPVAVARAGTALAFQGQTVTLDGSESQGAASHAWVQTGGTPAALIDPDAAVASFVAPDPAGLIEAVTFALTATNECSATAIDTVSVVIVGR